VAVEKRVLVVQGLHPDGLKILEERADVEPVVLMSDNEAEIAAGAHDVSAITVRTAPITRKVIEAASNLEVVSRHGVGYDSVDVAALTTRGIPLAIANRSNMVSVAEHVMFMLLALAKEGAYYDGKTRRSDWGNRWDMKAWELAGKRLLVIGFGRVGSRVARRALAFDMQVYVCDPYIDQSLISEAGCRVVKEYRSALPDVDAVSVNCPLTEETRHMIAQTELSAMKPSAVIVNCARGPIVDERALYAALTNNSIRGAGLDVFAAEPCPADNLLFQLDNVIVSPHIAGVTMESAVRMAIQTAQNVLDVFDGRLEPEVVVNRQVLKA